MGVGGLVGGRDVWVGGGKGVGGMEGGGGSVGSGRKKKEMLGWGGYKRLRMNNFD